MKSYGITIQMKPPLQCFQMVLFIQYEALTFEPRGWNPMVLPFE